MRTFFNYFALLLVGLGLMLLGADLVTSLEHQEITLRSFLEVWAMVNKGAVAHFTAWINQATPSYVAGAIFGALSIPAWSVGVIGMVIAFLTGHKHADE